jgi:UDP-N-acetylmuramate--alanine ligase
MSERKRPKRSVHFIGIGGIGMSALARYFLSQKWTVSGSDVAESGIFKILRKEGVRGRVGHKRSNLSPDIGLVVRSQAIRPENPEWKEARRRGIRTLTYPEAIAELTEQYRTVAVAGAHGKSTTTALAALTLIKGGFDPTVIVGTNLKEFEGPGAANGKNFRSGKSEYFVLEADEFGNAFSHYSPAVAIVTNIDREHLDVYKNLENIKKAFLEFMENVSGGGALILNRDDKNLYSLKPAVTFLAKKESLRVVWYSLRDPKVKKIKRAIKISGEHNLSNATAVYKLGELFKIQEKKILAAIGSYHGAWRRMEYRGEFCGAKGTRGSAPVFDDYAHHPTEIKATLAAFREKYPGKKIVCVFQPHQAKRLAALFEEFTTAFDGADETIILPVYKVTGRDEKPNRLDAAALARIIQKNHPKKSLIYLARPKNIKKALLALPTPQSSKVIVMMGAGDIVNLTDSLLS